MSHRVEKPRVSPDATAEGTEGVLWLQRGKGKQRERTQMFPFSLWVSSKMFGSWICKEDPDGGNRSCSLLVEPECLWECGVEGWQGAAPGLGGLRERGVGGSHPHTPSVCGSGANQPDTGCLGVCWGWAMKAIALNKTMFPSSVSFGSEAVSPNVLS